MSDWYQFLSVFTSVSTALITVIGILLWYIVRNTVSDMRILEKNFTDHQLYIANNYAKIVDVKSSYDSLCKIIGEMQDTINKMAVSTATIAAKMNIHQGE